jgi:hypothetical protein
MLMIFIPIFLIAQTDKVKISGEYSYTYGDSESLTEAKEICYTMALRNAIESHQTFITSTATVKDYKMIKDLVKTLSLGHVEDIEVVKESIEDRTIYYKVEGYVNPVEVQNVLSREIKKAKKQPEFESIIENEHIKILSVKEGTEGNYRKLWVVYQQKKTGGYWRKGRYYGVVNEGEHLSDGFSTILITYFDRDGNPIESERVYTKKGLLPGEIRRPWVRPPNDAKSYDIQIK